MFFTYVVRPGEAPEGRGPQFEPFWSFVANYSLRLGLFTLLGAYICLLMTVSAGMNDPLALLNVLRAAPESAGEFSSTVAMPLSCGAPSTLSRISFLFKTPSLLFLFLRRLENRLQK